jgi:hypothetical protein
MRLSLSKRLTLLSLIIALSIGLLASPLSRIAATEDLSRVYTVSIQFSETDNYPGHLKNFQVALGQLDTFLGTTALQSGTQYSFISHVLGGGISPKAGYVNTPNGYGDGINAAASLLNRLVHQTMFWDSDGVQKTVFQQINATTIKNDKTLGPYAVRLTMNAAPKPEDYVWQVNPAYNGPTLHIVSQYDSNQRIASLTVSYADEVAPPTVRGLDKDILTRNLKALIGNRRLGVSIIPLDNPANEIGVNENVQVPSASAWKGPGVIYFFENTPRELWANVPVRFWNLRNPLRVPNEYRDKWLANYETLRHVYVMAVFSGNHEAANVISYVFQHMPPTKKTNNNAITSFNNWTRIVVGMSHESGLYSWNYGDLETQKPLDLRYANRRLDTGSESLAYSQTFSARDLALAFYHLATKGKERGYYDVAMTLLSIRTDIISKIEGQVPPEIHTASKDGYFGPESPLSLGHDVNNDAGILIFPDGRTYIVAVTAFDAVDIQSDVVGIIVRALIEDDQAAAENTN